MLVLRRHRLVRLTPAGWDAALADAATVERAVLATWRRDDLPLVVARQDGVAPGRVRLGLPAPATHARRRVTLAVVRAHLRAAGDFPAARRVGALLASAQGPAWRALVDDLAHARVYGSYGWECLTGLPYVHARSDIDLLLPVDDALAADAVTARLERALPELPRLDGELVFADGRAVAWREWRQWRAGRVGELLVKRLDGVSLEPAPEPAS
jgi:phosphoribosyl-dephospho-CoA transferase